MRLFILCFTIITLFLTAHLIYEEYQENKLHQEIITLEKIPYDEAFLTEIQKLDGFLSVSPVYEIPVKLRWGDYTMDTTFTAVDFETFRSTGTGVPEIETGNTPILLIGKDTISNFTDPYGHAISQKSIQKFWASAETPVLEYCFPEDTFSGNLSTNSENSISISVSTIPSDNLLWRPCLAAGQLTNPSEGIYLPLMQLKNLTDSIPPVRKILLTTKGVKSIPQ